MPIPIWLIAPFVLLLLAIAIFPLAFPRFWERNFNKGVVVVIISIPVLLWLGLYEPREILHTTKEYFSFICLLGSLFTISGGIALTGDLKATPKINAAFLAIGAVLANFVGTTGASMILIRPFLKTNSERKNVGHLVVFFIFIVSNCGGLLTPLGDPPLFLGFLRGVPFFWTLTLFPAWLVANLMLLAIFYVWDSLAYGRESAKNLKKDAAQVRPLKFDGWRNLFFLGGVLYGVFLPSPYRELLMIHMALLSIVLGSRVARRQNHFSWSPIVEVAILFAGIFITMVPALAYLRLHGTEFGISRPWEFFWLTGGLSGFLDNAPTYLTFLSLAQGLGLSPEIVGVPERLLAAISIGAVFMGANTYIGNGPNFMVKAIADHVGFKAPSFFGYMFYSICILIPIFGLIHLIFFR